MLKHALLGSFAVMGVIAIHCGGSSVTPPNIDPNRVPQLHRASAMACDMTRPPITSSFEGGGVPDSGFPGQCNQDSDCTMGKNGRCGYSRIGKECSYDTCFQDSECTNGGVCICRTSATDTSANHCVGNSMNAGTCRVDSDCGAKGWCSPSADSCGPGYGTKGFYCHTSSDTCLDDADCKDGGGSGGGGLGYCMFDPMVKHWQCSYSLCAG